MEGPDVGCAVCRHVLRQLGLHQSRCLHHSVQTVKITNNTLTEHDTKCKRRDGTVSTPSYRQALEPLRCAAKGWDRLQDSSDAGSIGATP